jgi:hypothetical protein
MGAQPYGCMSFSAAAVIAFSSERIFDCNSIVRTEEETACKTARWEVPRNMEAEKVRMEDLDTFSAGSTGAWRVPLLLRWIRPA